VKLNRDDVAKMGLMALLSAPPIAFMTFDFMFPNISTPSLEKNLMVVFLISILAAVPSGYFTRRTDLAMVTVFLYTAVGYILAVALYSAPYTIFNLEQVLPAFYYAMFFRFTVVLLFLFVLGGFIGTVFGQMVRDMIRKEQTSLTFKDGNEG
jgi:VIT1/CCC1 family predicted Fe2+/Mn2+ transporter